MKTINRRDFIRASAAGFGLAIVSTGLSSCSQLSSASGKDKRLPVSFDHGVASGDPLTDRAIIWTRLSVANAEDTTIAWEVREAHTNKRVINGEATVTAQTDHTIKIDAAGLEAGRAYRYRFSSNGVASPQGYFKTLAIGDVASAKFAVVSCANYPAGYFNVYGAIGKRQDLDAVLHLGDYIYEYGSGGYATERAAELGRELATDNNTETLTLSDYRKRYALYRSDQQLQACHQAHTFITVWDDHEITNDAHISAAENHDASEGDYQSRKLQALQAYFEWMPIRPASQEDGDYKSYRQFSYGNLLDLYMLDTRIVGRDPQLEYKNYLGEDGFKAKQFNQDLADPNRNLLGLDQLRWLQNAMTDSKATWQVLGQQILMGRMNLPAAIVTRQMSFEEYGLTATVAQIAARLKAGDSSVTEQEKQVYIANQQVLNDKNLALIQQAAIPYNLDAWDGYTAERERVLATAKQLRKNFVVLAGDTHNAWANQLTDNSGSNVGVEFATSSVSSPGLESYIGLDDINAAINFEQNITRIVDGLHYHNSYDRGFLEVSFTPNAATAEWLFVDTVHATDYTINEARGHRMVVPVNSHQLA